MQCGFLLPCFCIKARSLSLQRNTRCLSITSFCFCFISTSKVTCFLHSKHLYALCDNKNVMSLYHNINMCVNCIFLRVVIPSRRAPFKTHTCNNNKNRGSLILSPTASQVEGHGFEPGIAPVAFIYVRNLI